ncbi:MAG: non-canonical purine NTP pyrophosphatase [Pirellulales bacterium]
MPKLRQLVLGTHNRSKGGELAELVRSLPCEVKTLADFPEAIEVVEDGDSFAANARRKASGQAVHLGAWVLGEDSGLEVESLGGSPGIFSARYAGADATDDQNNRKLLAELDGLPPARRRARYVCHAALADPTGEIRGESEDFCCGRILTQPAGEHGFGYDPLFEIVEYHRTFGQLGPAVKRCLSHRSRAIRRLVPSLRNLMSLRWV